MKKTSLLKDRSSYEKVKDEYNNLYGFNIGINEHSSDDLKSDLNRNTLKDEFKIKKG